jgi:methylamine dehydrogenase heavy chain
MGSSRRWIPAIAIGAPLLAAALALATGGDPESPPIPREALGQVATVPEWRSPHWLWVGDMVLRRSALVDADSGRFLGMVNGGYGVASAAPITSRERSEVYLPETHYSRGSRGERTDLVSIYDSRTLAPLDEVLLPPKRADNGNGVALAALLDDGRFLVVFNQTPATSVSVVDVNERRFLGEIQTGGCALVYPAGPRRFAMPCGDGSSLLVTLNAQGGEASRVRGPVFFDPQEDPITEKGSRRGQSWLFVSFEGQLHELDLSGGTPAPREPWSLLSDADRADSWRIGGWQHLAIHQSSGRLFSLVHQGERGSHKDSGSQVWVYDLASRERIQRIDAPNLMAAFLGQLIEIESGGVADWLVRRLVPNLGVDSVRVTQDDEPLLFLANRNAATVSVHDARSGEAVRELSQLGLSTGLMVVP